MKNLRSFYRKAKGKPKGEPKGSHLDRLSENGKPKKLYIGSRGLMTRKFVKIPIPGQPV